jgi:hypothetical protein
MTIANGIFFRHHELHYAPKRAQHWLFEGEMEGDDSGRAFSSVPMT